MQRLRLGRALGVDDRLERLVLDDDQLGRAPRLLRMLGGDDARPARRSSGRGRSRARAGRRTRARTSCCPGTSSCVSTACTPAASSAAERSIAATRACACGLRSVWPQSIPGRVRSLAYANSPVVFGDAVDAAHALADAAELELARRRTRRRCSSRARPRPHGVEDLRVAGAAAEVAGRAPRGSRRRSDPASAASRSAVATTSPGVQKPHCTAPASTNASCTGCRPSPAAEPLDRDDVVPVRLRREHEARAHERRRRAAPSRSRTRPARTRSSSRAARAARAARRAGSRPPRRPPRARSPLTVSAISHAARHLSSARRVSTRSAWRRYAAVPRTSSIGLAAAATLLREAVAPRRAARRRRARDRACRAERGAQLAALAVDRERERADGDHHRVARPDLHERLRGAARLRRAPRRSARPRASAFRFGPTRNSVSGSRRVAADARAARPRRPSTSSGGSASPAGEAVPRLPPIVPRLRICGEPTVREASASAGSSVAASSRSSPPCR